MTTQACGETGNRTGTRTGTEAELGDFDGGLGIHPARAEAVEDKTLVDRAEALCSLVCL